jgi:DNA-directed RNA polymerase subunit alpha
MRYSMTIGDKIAEIQCSDFMTIEQLELVKEMLSKAIDTKIAELRKAEENKLPLTASIRDMYPELSTRTLNVLLRNNKNTIADVLNCTPTEVMNIRNMGRKSFEEIQERFSKYGKFREEGKTNG